MTQEQQAETVTSCLHQGVWRAYIPCPAILLRSQISHDRMRTYHAQREIKPSTIVGSPARSLGVLFFAVACGHRLVRRAEQRRGSDESERSSALGGCVRVPAVAPQGDADWGGAQRGDARRSPGPALVRPMIRTPRYPSSTAARRYDPARLTLCGVSGCAHLLAPVNPTPTPTRPLSVPGAALIGLPAGAPIHVGPFDLCATMIGAGVARPGDGLVILGATLGCGVLADEVVTGGPLAGILLRVPRPTIGRA